MKEKTYYVFKSGLNVGIRLSPPTARGFTVTGNQFAMMRDIAEMVWDQGSSLYGGATVTKLGPVRR